MVKVFWVAWREFKHTALTKAFIIGTIVFPLLIWGGMAAGSIFARPSVETLTGDIAIIDTTGAVIRSARDELSPDGPPSDTVDSVSPSELTNATPDEAAEHVRRASPFAGIINLNLNVIGVDNPEQFDELRESVRAGEIHALAVVDEEVLTPVPTRQTQRNIQLYVQERANPNHTDAIRRALQRSVVRARADLVGHDYDDMQRLLRNPSLQTMRLTETGETAAGVEFQQLLPLAFMVLLWISAFASGNYLLTTTVEEKSNKVMEVLLSAVSPMQLMAGKICGQAVVGMFTVLAYGALGIAALLIVDQAGLITFTQVLALIIYYLMAYFMIAAIMAGIGSMVSDMQEAHALITPAMLVLFIPLILLVPINQNPNGLLATITTSIPPFTPFVMIVRITASDPVPLWQVLASFAVGIAGVIITMWLSARVFRIGVLMQGKPPSPIELARWLRYS